MLHTADFCQQCEAFVIVVSYSNNIYCHCFVNDVYSTAEKLRGKIPEVEKELQKSESALANMVTEENKVANEVVTCLHLKPRTHDKQCWPTNVVKHLLANICVTRQTNVGQQMFDNSMAEMADSADDDDVAAAVICLIACKRKRRRPKSVRVQSWIM